MFHQGISKMGKICSRWFLLLLLSNIVLTRAKIIKSLPGFSGELPFTLETGYIGVGKLEAVQLFYYFIESERSPKDDPLLLWLTGGPGCSGFSGLVYEIGPLRFNYAKSRGNKPTFELNPSSWTKVANIIFLDAPAGTGFSYSETLQGYYASDTSQAADNYEFLRKWLLAHPNFKNNPLYIAGDSYSGIIVPMVVEEITKGNEMGRHPPMYLQGYVLGNPGTDLGKDINSRAEFAHLKGLISDELYESMKANCKGNYTDADPGNEPCTKDLLLYSECTANINLAQILEPKCNSTLSPRNRTTKLEWDFSALMEDYSSAFLSLAIQLPGPWCRYYNYVFCYIWLNDKTVREVLGIRQGTKENWVRCNKSLSYTEDLTSSLEIHRNLTNYGYRVLIYSGDHDMVVPYVGTLAWIESLNLTFAYTWSPWFVDGQVAGYSLQYQQSKYTLTFATVKNGGHTAPEYRPKQCLAMVNRWFAYYPLQYPKSINIAHEK